MHLLILRKEKHAQNLEYLKSAWIYFRLKKVLINII